jgi:hypothetical protein
MEAGMNVEHRTALAYFVEAFGALILLGCAVYVQRHWSGSGSFRSLVDLAPAIPVWLILFSSIRHYRRIDEYQRLVYLQIVSLSAGILFCLDWSYPYLRDVFGLPPFPGVLSWPFSVVFLIVTAWVSRSGKRARAG